MVSNQPKITEDVEWNANTLRNEMRKCEKMTIMEKSDHLDRLMSLTKSIQTMNVDSEIITFGDIKDKSSYMGVSLKQQQAPDEFTIRTPDVEAQFGLDICALTGVYCDMFSGDDYIFKFPPTQGFEETKPYRVCIFHDNEQYSVSSFVMPMPGVIRELISESQLNTEEDMYSFIRKCRQHVLCYYLRKEQYKKLKTIIANLKNCAVQATMGYDRIFLELTGVHDQKHDTSINITIDLVYRSDEIAPYKIKVEWDKESKIPDGVKSRLKYSVQIFRNEDLSTAFESLMTTAEDCFSWERVCQKDSDPLQEVITSGEEDDFADLLAISQKLVKNQRKKKKTKKNEESAVAAAANNSNPVEKGIHVSPTQRKLSEWVHVRKEPDKKKQDFASNQSPKKIDKSATLVSEQDGGNSVIIKPDAPTHEKKLSPQTQTEKRPPGKKHITISDFLQKKKDKECPMAPKGKLADSKENRPPSSLSQNIWSRETEEKDQKITAKKKMALETVPEECNESDAVTRKEPNINSKKIKPSLPVPKQKLSTRTQARKPVSAKKNMKISTIVRGRPSKNCSIGRAANNVTSLISEPQSPLSQRSMSDKTAEEENIASDRLSEDPGENLPLTRVGTKPNSKKGHIPLPSKETESQPKREETKVVSTLSQEHLNDDFLRPLHDFHSVVNNRRSLLSERTSFAEAEAEAKAIKRNIINKQPAFDSSPKKSSKNASDARPARLPQEDTALRYGPPSPRPEKGLSIATEVENTKVRKKQTAMPGSKKHALQRTKAENEPRRKKQKVVSARSQDSPDDGPTRLPQEDHNALESEPPSPLPEKGSKKHVLQRKKAENEPARKKQKVVSARSQDRPDDGPTRLPQDDHNAPKNRPRAPHPEKRSAVATKAKSENGHGDSEETKASKRSLARGAETKNQPRKKKQRIISRALDVNVDAAVSRVVEECDTSNTAPSLENESSTPLRERRVPIRTKAKSQQTIPEPKVTPRLRQKESDGSGSHLLEENTIPSKSRAPLSPAKKLTLQQAILTKKAKVMISKIKTMPSKTGRETPTGNSTSKAKQKKLDFKWESKENVRDRIVFPRGVTLAAALNKNSAGQHITTSTPLRKSQKRSEVNVIDSDISTISFHENVSLRKFEKSTGKAKKTKVKNKDAE